MLTPRPLRLLALFVPGLFFTFANAAPADDLDAVADRYLAAYTGQHLDELATYYTPESVFDDPTSEGYWRQRFRVTGGEQIVGAMRSGWTLLHGFNFEVEKRITYHDRVVLIGTSHLTLDGAMFGAKPGVDYTVALQAVTILRIVDGKILEHLDHYDYAPLGVIAREARN
ncbi:nuclear transport factor 2 family protein [Actomonas aquatica]|uniref:Ester cyclase n=1 Tax=Actomonas aquatica TaxID=2866162 RepID=A0ABZ1CAQ7_9BACT|nr:nuclear transport factor 2 family protein [Opitutus sp. WL0086]WRQ88387.1 ester cyclase [Opitutus sp. WL0086]